MLTWKFFRSKLVAIIWLTTITVLFFLPGSSLPESGWFGKVQMDKWIHISFFAALVFLFCSAFSADNNNFKWIAIIAVLYGIGIEFAQQAWVPNRSFDIYDIVADAAGVWVGLWIWWKVYKKNKPL